MNLYMLHYDDSVLGFAQDVSIWGRSVQQWRLRMMAQGATLEETTGRILRRLSMRSKLFDFS